MLGNWYLDKYDLPGFEYTGKIPYSAVCKDGSSAKLPDDPWFLLGNYQLTLFTHVSGMYELITGQRSWGRMNLGDKPDTGNNTCTLSVKNDGKLQKYNLVGMDSLCADEKTCSRKFGCGYAQYTYNLPELKITRTLSVMPSTKINNGIPAFLLTMDFTNKSDSTLEMEFSEGLTAHYTEIQFQYVPEVYQKVKFTYKSFVGNIADETKGNKSLNISSKLNYAGYRITGKSDDPLLTANPDDMAMIDVFPPDLFMLTGDKKITIKTAGRNLSALSKITLQPGEKSTLQLIIGFIPVAAKKIDEKTYLTSIFKDLSSSKNGMFLSAWNKIIPSLEKEKDETLRREMRWHAYFLEAMATYSEYYHETKIPQGTIYDFDWGKHASARDNFQHALPCVYYNPKLAKSTMRYMLQRATAFGEIRLIEYGNGYAEHEGYFTSDQQLFFFLLLSEYLKATGDYTFLNEAVEPYPSHGQKKIKVMDFVKAMFTFLRDTIGVGQHGIVRLYNSDWNDTLYYIEPAPYNLVVRGGESLMNSAMAVSIFQDLVPELKKGGADKNLTGSMELYKNQIYDAFVKDYGNRTFPRRMYFNGKAYGENNMFLEPMGYTLMIKNLGENRKITLYKEMQKRVYPGEKMGARQQEKPEFESPHYDKGSRENGGFWWALNGPVILGVATFDKTEAWRLLRMMTLENCSKQFPDYWTCYWDAADNLESSLIPQEGLSDQSENYSAIPNVCAHPHAWNLFCYYKLKN